MECDSDRHLMNDLMNEPRMNDHIWPQSGHASFREVAQEHTPEHVVWFLEGIGLGHHVTTFIEQDMLLELDQENSVRIRSHQPHSHTGCVGRESSLETRLYC